MFRVKQYSTNQSGILKEMYDLYLDKGNLAVLDVILETKRDGRVALQSGDIVTITLKTDCEAETVFYSAQATIDVENNVAYFVFDAATTTDWTCREYKYDIRFERLGNYDETVVGPCSFFLCEVVN